MKRRLIYRILSMLVTISMLVQIPTLAMAASEKSDNRNSSNEEFDDYEEDLEKVADVVDRANNSYDDGLDESDDGNEKAALKEFKKAYGLFQKADEKLDDLDPPKSAKSVDEMMSDALDKYKKGTKMIVEAEKDDDGEKADEANEIMAEGSDLERKVIASLEADELLDEASSEDTNEAKIAAYLAVITKAPDTSAAEQAKEEIKNIANQYANSISADIATANTTIAELDQIPEGAEFSVPEIFGSSAELGRIAGTLGANPNTANLAAIFNKLSQADNSGASIFGKPGSSVVDPRTAKKQRDTTQRLLDEAKALIAQG